MRGAQSVGNSGSVNGTVLDPTGAVVAGAKVEIRNPVSGFDRSTTTDKAGTFAFTNIPFNPLSPERDGCRVYGPGAGCRAAILRTDQCICTITLQVAGSTTAVTVEAAGGDLVENDPTFHTDVDKNLFDKLAAGEPVVVSEFAGDLVDPGNLRRLEWPVPWPGRSRGKFVLGGWPTHHRSAKQDFLQPDSSGFDSVDGGHRGRAAGGIRRQDQRGHQCHHTIGTRHDHAAWRV